MPEACNFIEKETLTQVFSCHFGKISKNTFFIEHLRVTASAMCTGIRLSKQNFMTLWKKRFRMASTEAATRGVL